jgi:hypothetical protein
LTGSERIRQIQCPYCYKFYPIRETSIDHVIATSWYPANVPTTFQRYTVCSCRGCNDRFGKLEENLLHHLALCLNPEDTAVCSIVEKVRRALDPSMARGLADRQNRESRRRAILNDMLDASGVPLHRIANWTVPNLKDGQPQRAIRVPTILADVVGKWVRGIHYKTTKSLLPEGYVVHSIPVTDDFEVDNFSFIQQKAQDTFARGPGIAIARWTIHQKNVRFVLYTFTIWDVFSVYAAATPSDQPIREMKLTVDGNVVIA